MTAAALPTKRDRRGWLAAPAAIVLLALFVYPFLYGLVISFQPMEGGRFWANYAHFFSTATDWGTLWTTFKLAAPATLINLGMAVPVPLRCAGPAACSAWSPRCWWCPSPWARC